jgi:Protein of unknown function (DUF935).
MTNRKRQSYATKDAPEYPTTLPGQIATPPSSILGGSDLVKNTAVPVDMEVGVTGLAQFSGLIFQEPLVELRGKEAYKRYNEMRLNSPIVGALLMSNENPLRGMSWTFSSNKGEEDPRLELLDSARANLCHSWNDHISEALTMIPFGFSMFETVYQNVDGQMLWHSFSPRGQDTVYRWLYEEIRNSAEDQNPKQKLRGFVQLAPPHYRPTAIPIERLMTYRLRAERDNPEGRSMLRTAWVPYYYVKHIQQIEAIGIERDLAGLPVIHLPAGATTGGDTTDDAKAAKIVRNIRNDEQSGLVLPDGWTAELMSTGGTRAFDTDKIITRYEKRILMSCLAQFLMLGQDGAGSLALSTDQTDFFTMSVNSVADIIAETFTKCAIPQLMELNGYDCEGLRLEHTPAQGNAGATVVADFLQKLQGAITLDANDEIWLRQVLRMPEKDVEQIKIDREEADAKKAEQQNILLEKMKQGQQNAQQQPAQKMRADMYAANPHDEKKRLALEKELNQVMRKFFDAQKRRVLKAAKELR